MALQTCHQGPKASIAPSIDLKEAKGMAKKLDTLADQASHNRIKVEEIASRVDKLLDNYNSQQESVYEPISTALEVKPGKATALEYLESVNNSISNFVSQNLQEDSETVLDESLSTPRCAKMLDTVLDSTGNAKEKLESALSSLSQHVQGKDLEKTKQIESMKEEIENYSVAIEKATRQATIQDQEIQKLNCDIRKLGFEKELLLSKISDIRSDYKDKMKVLSEKINSLISEKDTLKRKNVKLLFQLKRTEIRATKAVAVEPSVEIQPIPEPEPVGTLSDLLVSGKKTDESKPNRFKMPHRAASMSQLAFQEPAPDTEIDVGVEEALKLVKEDSPVDETPELYVLQLQLDELQREKQAAERQKEEQTTTIRRLSRELNIIKIHCNPNIEEIQLSETPPQPIDETLPSDSIIPRRRNTIDFIPTTLLEDMTIQEEDNESDSDDSDSDFSDEETPPPRSRRASIACVPRTFDNALVQDGSENMDELKRQIADIKMQRDAYLNKLSVVESENEHLKKRISSQTLPVKINRRLEKIIEPKSRRKSFSEQWDNPFNPNGLQLTSIRKDFLDSLKVPAKPRNKLKKIKDIPSMAVRGKPLR